MSISIKRELKQKVYVLAVDDREENVSSLQQILSAPDLEVITASSGPDALKKVLKYEFACILLDIRMPGMDGFEVAHLIRSDQDLAHTPIIFVTAEAKDQEELFLGYERGAVDFLIKPLSPIVLRAKVRVFADLFRQKKALDKSKLIEQLFEQLQDSNDELKQYTHIASHDMREPVRRIMCLVDMLKLEADAAKVKSVTSLCDDLHTCAVEMVAFVDDFRDLTNIVNAPHTFTDTDLRPLIETVLAQKDHVLKVRRIGITISDHPRIKCNPTLVTELIGHLVDNALIQGGDGLKIKFSAVKTNDEWVMSVYNSGSSVDPKKTDAIFQPFTRLKRSDKSSHLGMGLTKVKKIIDHHGGKIWVEPETSGVSFKFTLSRSKND